MLRLVLFLLATAAVATGLAWLADTPGNLVIEWQDYRIQTSVFRAVVLLAFLIGLAVVAWNILRQVWLSPAAVGQFFTRRRQQRGLDALSGGMIAIGAGDRALASRYAQAARKSLPNEPMTHLLRAQAAQLSGDRATSRRIFEAMLSAPDTEQLGLRGLFLEAEREGEMEAARQFAERAVRLNPKLAWAVDALFDLQCKSADYAGALDTLATARKHGQVEKSVSDRRRAVLLTAQAQALEDSEPGKALDLALEAHGLASDLIPAAAIAGRMLASRGQTPRAAKIIEKTWKRSPHPELATVYAYARPGDSPRDRLERLRRLVRMTPSSGEAPIALAETALEGRDTAAAREALQPLLDGRLTQRVCKLMARIENEDGGDKGRVREWLARAVNAPRDPAWTADGYVSDRWLPISPITGALDAFQWRVPFDEVETPDSALISERLEELVTLGAPDKALPAAASPGVRGSGSSLLADDDVPVTIATVTVAPTSPVTPVMSPTARPAPVPASVPAPAPAIAAAARAAIVEPTAEARRARAEADVAVVDPTAPRPMSGARPIAAVAGTGTAARVTTAAGFGHAVRLAPHAPDDPGPDADEPVEPAPVRSATVAATATPLRYPSPKAKT